MREYVAVVTGRRITVKEDFVAFHRWKDAPEPVSFLRDMHRHLFKVLVIIDVSHADRQVEFFDAQKTLRSILRKDFEGKRMDLSCEQMAEEIGHRLAFNCYPVVAVEVSEDGENAGRVHFDCHPRNSGESSNQPVKLVRAFDGSTN